MLSSPASMRLRATRYSVLRSRGASASTRAKRALPGWALQFGAAELQAPVQSRQDGVRGEEFRPGGSQLDGQRHPIQPGADGNHMLDVVVGKTKGRSNHPRTNLGEFSVPSENGSRKWGEVGGSSQAPERRKVLLQAVCHQLKDVL